MKIEQSIGSPTSECTENPLTEMNQKSQVVFDDIKYFEKELLNAFVDKDWNRIIQCAKRLKLIEEA